MISLRQMEELGDLSKTHQKEQVKQFLISMMDITEQTDSETLYQELYSKLITIKD